MLHAMLSPDWARAMRNKLLRWAPWNYRCWREIACWCYERSLHNPAVVSALDFGCVVLQ